MGVKITDAPKEVGGFPCTWTMRAKRARCHASEHVAMRAKRAPSRGSGLGVERLNRNIVGFGVISRSGEVLPRFRGGDPVTQNMMF